MKTLTFFIAFNIVTIAVFGQAAGNWFYNQKKSSSTISNSAGFNELSFDSYAQQNIEQQYTSKSISYFNDTIIVLETKILMNAMADEYSVIFGISQVGETIDNCHIITNERINKFVTDIKNIGVNKENVYVDFISQVPIFEIEVEKKLFSKTYHEVPAGFEVKKNIHISIKKNSDIDKLLEIAAKNEIYDIIKVDYIIKNNDAVYDTIRAEAIKNINRKKADFEKLEIDFTSTYKTVLENSNTVFPIERYSAYKAFNSNQTTKTSGKTIVTNNNQVDIFYNKYPYNYFDKVLKAEILEPSIQFLYTLKVKYVLKKK